MDLSCSLDFSSSLPGAMVEIFSVAIEPYYTDNMDEVEVEGVVQLNNCNYDDDFPIDLFNPALVEGDSPIFPDDETLHLTGPQVCLRCQSWFVFIDLKDKRGDTCLCHGTYEYLGAYGYGYPFDKPSSAIFRGEDCEVGMHFIMYKKAVQATVEISIVEDLGASFHGRIYAFSDKFDNDSEYNKTFFRSKLFYASQEKPKQLNGGIIQLSRDKVAMPIKSSLCIDVHLTNALTGALVCNDILKLPVEESGLISQEFSCGIKVSVSYDIWPLMEIDKERMSAMKAASLANQSLGSKRIKKSSVQSD